MSAYREISRVKGSASHPSGATDDVVGPRRKSWALVVIAAGMLTFFVPLVTTDTAVLGKTQWSVLDLATHVLAGKLPPSTRRFVSPAPACLGLGFMLLAVSLRLFYAAVAVLLSFHSLSRKLSIVGLTGIFVAAETWQWDKNSFEEILYGGWSYNNLRLVRHVGFGQLILAIIVVMGGLVYIARDKSLDGSPARENTPFGRHPRASQEPEFLDAEILPSEEELSDRPPRQPRLR